ncbi:MAG: thioredoxin domain-containing protein [Wenzhouxiangella sp.]|nr:thioredoxin domain-containing protein [Wenzhouxiangella sp.]TVR95269.1 MAG: thioredoxin domain-containing protein [Wenzhouxiangellaceae bacterium]
MTQRNELDQALSPYLLQHADNPVHWLEWNAESLALARQLNRPILLSVGYSACHWCHVMAHESFENERVAGLMNRHFVNIKVDREERPDLDRIYQLAHQLLTGRGGGWPLTVFLDPDSQAPFFAGTYFPLAPRPGLLDFPSLLERINEIWSTRQDELRAQNLQVQQALKAIAQPRPAAAGTDLSEVAEGLVGQLAARFDNRHGGFGDAPKFPQAPVLALLADLADDEQAAQMLADTLTAMARHGLFDHLGGGFFRYCVDAAWEIPHFEKMLSDNALLLELYARAAQRWQRPDFHEACERTVSWLTGEMALNGGCFGASQDADSSDGEGAYYLWTPNQVRDLLPAAQAELLMARYGLDGPPNFEEKAWHLVTARDVDELTTTAQGRDQAEAELTRARQLLLQARRQRPQPGRDDKLIGAWNGLTIAALSRAGRLLERSDWLDMAAEALNALAPRLFGQDPPRSVWRNGRSAQTATLDDLAAVLDACMSLLQWRFEPRWFNLARRIGRRIIAQHVDDQTSAVYLTPVDHEPLLTRPLALADDATPSGAGLALQGLFRLAQLCGDSRLHRQCELILNAALGDIAASPIGHASLIRAGLAMQRGGSQVLITGDAEVTGAWHRALFFGHGVAVFHLPHDLALEEPPALLAALLDGGDNRAVICDELACRAPVGSLEALIMALEE